jgi:DNA-binding MarR family transcriptional regulator
MDVKKNDYTYTVVAAMNGILKLTKSELRVLGLLLDEDRYNITKNGYRKCRIKSGYDPQGFFNVIKRLERKQIIMIKDGERYIRPASTPRRSRCSQPQRSARSSMRSSARAAWRISTPSPR